ncbi:MAG TPA: DUF4384 domain-containing protein [Pyrinomonadaceae bacterium]|nr:DUF4384 domain-containing protein [Pyrinomonadaceae bacterium]
MKKTFAAISVAVLIVTGAVLSLAQDEENVRGAFLTTRPKAEERKSSPKPARSRRRPKPAATSTPATTTPVKAEPTTGTGTPRIREQRIGLGLTLFMRDSNGMAVRVDPTREFREGDRIRVLLETNADGYLYIFNTTNEGPPVMLYPDPQLDEGGNYVQSHVPFEIPSSLAAEERLRWLQFDEHAGRERVYFVFSREPLSGIPLEEGLISFCAENKSSCPIKPEADLWARIQREVNQPMQVAKAQSYGKTETPGEREATTRGIGLSKEDPEPSLVLMTVSSDRNTLMTALDLTHK